MGRISIASGSGLALHQEYYPGFTGYNAFWALALFDNRLTHHKRDANGWHQYALLTDRASAPAPIVNVIDKGEYDYTSSSHYETSLALVLEGNTLTEFIIPAGRYTSTIQFDRGHVLSTSATGAAALIQGTFDRRSGPGNLEALVLEGTNIIHYWKDYSYGFRSWNRGVTVAQNASGPACLIQSDFDRNLEALILEEDKLVHYWRSTDRFEWHRGVTVAEGVTGPATMIQSGFRRSKKYRGNFEVLVQHGRAIYHYWRDNSAPDLPWHRGVCISDKATGSAVMMESHFGKSKKRPGNFEVLIPEGDDLIGYWRDNGPGLHWNRIPGVAI